MSNSYQVKTEIYEGPLDTLLSLIEKRKLFINEISLSQVADDYIGYVKNLENYPIAESAHFVLIASTLVLIKSKSLLPNLSLLQEEEDNIGDLENRLKQLEKYRALSKHLKDRFGINIAYMKLPSRNSTVVFSPHEKISVNNIFSTVKFLLSILPKKDIVPKAVVAKVITLEEMMDNLAHRITSSMKMSFREFAKVGQAEKVNVIVSFLAMLELVKQGVIQVRQDKDFQDIEIHNDRVGVPTF